MLRGRTPRGKALAEQLREEISLGVYEDLSSLAPNPRKDIVESARDELAAELAEREDRDRGG